MTGTRPTCGMAFGHWMEVVEGDVRLRLGPIRREDAGRFVAPEAGFGLQSYEVGRYLAMISAPTLQGEEAWWDKASATDEHLHWGVYLPTDEGDGDDGWKLVGTTTLHVKDAGRRRAESGFLLLDRAHWGQRVASTAHLGRTLYGFRELDLLAITSAAFSPNTGSIRALTGIGYVQWGVSYSDLVVGGRTCDTIHFLLPNPEEEAWRYFWRRPEAEIPPAFVEARARATETLRRAEAAVTFL